MVASGRPQSISEFAFSRIALLLLSVVLVLPVNTRSMSLGSEAVVKFAILTVFWPKESVHDAPKKGPAFPAYSCSNRIAKLGLLRSRGPVLFRIEAHEQFGQHCYDANQHFFAGLILSFAVPPIESLKSETSE